MANQAKCCGDYYTLYTNKGEPFYVDADDYDKVKNITWCKGTGGYIIGKLKGKNVSIHRLIMDFPKGFDVDHKHGEKSRHDNRKSNLRIATESQNCINKNIQSNNTSGCTGVSFDKGKQRWRAEIWFQGKRIHLGWFKDFEDAVAVRKQAEEEYFGEWSYGNSQKEMDLCFTGECITDLSCLDYEYTTPKVVLKQQKSQILTNVE